jgi:tetratricopeptide (TPR) repeat protein
VASDRARGGILPSDVDPQTIQLDPDQVAGESQISPAPPPSTDRTVEIQAARSAEHVARENPGLDPYQDGLDLKQSGRYEEAIKKFQEAEQDPAFRFLARVQQGMCLRAAGRLEEAAASFRRALAVNGAKMEDLLNVRYVLGQVLDKMGRFREAQEEYRLIHRVDPLFRDIADRVDGDDQGGRSPAGIGSRSQPMMWLRTPMAWWRSITSRRR